MTTSGTSSPANSPDLRPETLLREIAAAVSLILPTDYIARDPSGHCSTLLRRARDAHASRDWSQFYRYGKRRLIDLLQITPAEERHMRALISDGEKHRRHLASDHARRRAAGMVERTAYLAEAAQRQTRAAMLRQGGLSWPEVAHSLGLSTAEAARQLARRACRMCDPKEPYGSALYILAALLPSPLRTVHPRPPAREVAVKEAGGNGGSTPTAGRYGGCTTSRSIGGTEVIERPTAGERSQTAELDTKSNWPPSHQASTTYSSLAATISTECGVHPQAEAFEHGGEIPGVNRLAVVGGRRRAGCGAGRPATAE